MGGELIPYNPQEEDPKKDEAEKKALIPRLIGNLRKWVETKQQEEREQRSREFNAEKLMIEGGMAPVASYYSGLPGSLEDLDGERVIRMYRALERNKGKTEADDFAYMLLNMPSLAGTNVVNAILELERNNWVYDPDIILEGNRQRNPQDTRDVDNPDQRVLVSKIGGFAAISGERDDSNAVRRDIYLKFKKAEIEILPLRTISPEEEEKLARRGEAPKHRLEITADADTIDLGTRVHINTNEYTHKQ